MSGKLSEKPISYWLDQNDNNVYYVLYYTGLWDTLLLGMINIEDESIYVYCGSNGNDKRIISSFIVCSDSLDKQHLLKYKQLDDGYNSSEIKKHINGVIEKGCRNSPQNAGVKQLFLQITNANI